MGRGANAPPLYNWCGATGGTTTANTTAHTRSATPPTANVGVLFGPFYFFYLPIVVLVRSKDTCQV